MQKLGVTSVFANHLDSLARSVNANSQDETSRPMRYSNGLPIHSADLWLDGVCRQSIPKQSRMVLSNGLEEAIFLTVKPDRR
jgi:hypothetical protein